MIALQDQLLNEEGFTYFFCGQANQDGMENGFSNIRRGRGRPKPSALDFKYELKKLTIVGQDFQVAKASYKSSGTPSLIDFLLKFDKGVTKDDGALNSARSLPVLSECDHLSPQTQEILYRMCGYVILKLRRSIKCEGCYAGLQDGADKAASISAYVSSTDYTEGAQIRVSAEVFELLSTVERVMWHSRSQLMVMGRSTKEQLCAHLSTVVAPFNLTTCHNVKEQVVRRFVAMRLRQLSSVITAHYANKDHVGVSFSSRTMGGGTLTSSFRQRR